MNFGSTRDLEGITESLLEGVGAVHVGFFADGKVYETNTERYFTQEDGKAWYRHDLESPIAPRYVND